MATSHPPNGNAQSLPPLDEECFVISPIGEEGSDVRERADGILEYIIKPALEPLGLTAIPADQSVSPARSLGR